MARILAIDLGKKRTGLAQTDPLQIIASPFKTIETSDLEDFLKEYLNKEPVETIVLGYPTREDGSDTDMSQPVRDLEKKINKNYPGFPVVLVDERYTSKMAVEAMVRGGTKKKYRREKGNIDRTSATLILQEYLETRKP